ncbi:MAG: adenylyltransferase/cytidyltransferase family protein, partial [Rhodothermales bacterium]
MVRPRSKIISPNDLKARISALRKEGKRIVLCHGAFDLIHPGHIRFLEAARSLGGALVVSMLPDQMIDKGPGRPVFNERLRGESLAALQSVDLVLPSMHPSAAEMIRLVEPDVFVTGIRLDVDELEAVGVDLETAAQSVGAELHVTDDVAFSSTKLLNSYFEVLTPEAQEFLRDFAGGHQSPEIIERLRSTSNLRILVLGDCIIDEYHVCSVMGRSSKSPSLNARYLHAEAHAGGAVAIANHLAGYSNEVHLVSGVGAMDDH